jgi:hypothetical protein
MRTRVLPIVILAAFAALLAGCSATDSASVEAGGVSIAQGAPEVGAPAPDAIAQANAAPADVSSVVTSERQVVKNAYVTMRVDDVAQSAFAIHGLVAKHSGLISAEDTQASGESTNSMITAQVPAADLDAFVAEVSRLGTVDAVTVSAQDVTGQVVDLDARIKALQTSVDRMTQLLAQAQKMDDLLAIETQLSTRQAELDSLNAQRKALGEQVALSTVTITLSPMSSVTPVDAPGFLSGLMSGWAALVSVVTVMFTAAGFLLPFAIIALVIVIPIVIVLVRRIRRHPGAVTPSSDSDDDDRAPLLTTT